MFYESPVFDFEDPTVYIWSRTLQENVPKTLKPVSFLVAFYIKSRKFQDVRNSGYISKQKIPFYDEDYVYQASKIQPMLSTNKVVYFCQVSKL